MRAHRKPTDQRFDYIKQGAQELVQEQLAEALEHIQDNAERPVRALIFGIVYMDDERGRIITAGQPGDLWQLFLGVEQYLMVVPS